MSLIILLYLTHFCSSVFVYIAGEGTWTFDTSLPLLQELAKAVGTDLTPEACAARYAESWNASHSNSAEAEE